MRKVVVEDALTNVSSYLRSKGCEVSKLSDQRSLDDCDAVVVSGQDKNFTGAQDTLTKAMVIDACGKTPEDIYNQISDNL